MTPLRRSMIDAMILRGFALRAQESDIDATGFAGTGAVCNATASFKRARLSARGGGACGKTQHSGTTINRRSRGQNKLVNGIKIDWR